MEKITSHSKLAPIPLRLPQKLLFKGFEAMQRGRLHITIPGQQDVILGSTDEVQATLTVHHPQFFTRCLRSGDIGFAEAYMEGDFDTDNLVNLLKWFLLNIDASPGLSGSQKSVWWINLLKPLNRLQHFLQPNNRQGGRKNIAAHYDLSNDFFATFLDESRTYSSALLENDLNLREGQIRKYQRLCKKIHLSQDDHVLEIGSGWGGFALYAAKNFGCQVTTTTISQKQYEHVQKLIQSEGLQEKITLLFQDYRDLQGSFDKIVSIEMLEAVGHEYFPIFFQQCAKLLKPQGLMGLQVILCHDSRYQQLRKGVDFIQKYIFPGSLLPSLSRLLEAANQKSAFSLHNYFDMASSYAKTLSHWRENFLKNLDHIREMRFDEPFIRRWLYYFAYCEAGFSMRNITVAQMILTQPNNTSLKD